MAATLICPERPESPLFSDGIGDRVVSTDATTGDLVQVLRINPALTAVPSFEFALRERVARLANFRHGAYARVRRVDRAAAHATALSVVSDHIEGTRLSDIMRVAEEHHLHLDINAALCLVRQLVPALALLHENARDAAHGLVSLERLIITPQGRLVVAEHVCGAAVEQMQFGRERLWHEFRVAMPPSAGIPRFDQRGDVTGIGVVALSLVLGRPLRGDEFPGGAADLLNGARERSALGVEQPLSAPLRSWLARALQLDVRRAFGSAPEAMMALDEITADGSTYVAAPVALETFLSGYATALLAPPPASAPAPRPLEVMRPFDGPLAPVSAPTAEDPPAASAPLPIRELSELLSDPLPDSLLAPLRDGTGNEEVAPLFDPAAPFSAPQVSLPAPLKPSHRRRLIVAAAALAIVASGGIAGYRVLAGGVPPALATLSVQSNPAGVPVFVDGVERGVTPARITLAAGAHILELRRGVPRVIPVTLTAGADVSQYLEFAETPVPESLLAPPAAAVAVVAPRTEPAPGATLAGWIVTRMPFAMEILEKGQLLGTTDADRLMLASGAHELEFVNAALAYRVTRTVNIAAGKVTNVALEIPRGVVNLNATPWAEVFLDGQAVGETPIGNLSVPIGAHEIVFRHPQFGEKRHAVSVTAGAPVRISVEMKQ
ncbi:MAG: PEGA domain-containing protein [Acidobacteria bacterium]|nr:PEGA domain-containing protein [Acidobacteriota bacterium]